VNHSRSFSRVQAFAPPSTVSVEPVMYWALSLARRRLEVAARGLPLHARGEAYSQAHSKRLLSCRFFRREAGE
jgi:hypothetical protein